MKIDANTFRSKYGPWALIAGASEGLGAAFTTQLAALGLHIAPVARRQALLEKLASDLAARHGVQTRPIALDLASPDAAATLLEQTRDLEIGLVVYNAALSPIGPFLDHDTSELSRALDLNCRTPLGIAHAFGRAMRPRGRGGILLVCSMSAYQGSPLLATYAATKAFELVLGEGLWDELQEHGLDVLAFCAGATRTPNYLASDARPLSRFAPAVMEPEDVAAEALATLGKTPSAIAGRANRVGGFVMNRLLPRRLAVRLMGRTTRSMYWK